MPDEAVRAAFDRIYSSTSRDVLLYLTCKCANPADVADLLQETYVEVFSALQKRGASYIENPKAFVVRIARQKLSRHYGLLQRLRSTVAFSQETDALPCQPPPDDWIDERLINDALFEKATALLAQKSVTVQKIFRLHYALELTIPEIARALGLTQSDVKNKLYRTLAQLREQLIL